MAGGCICLIINIYLILLVLSINEKNPYCALYVFQIIQFVIIMTDVRRENGKLCLLCQDDFSNTLILIPDEWSEMGNR